MHQLARIFTLVQSRSCTLGSSICKILTPSPAPHYAGLMATTTRRARTLSYCLRTEQVPPDLLSLFGGLPPSSGYPRRFCKILGSEMRNQNIFLKDCLEVSCTVENDGISGLRSYTDLLKIANYVTEFLWNNLRATLTPRQERYG